MTLPYPDDSRHNTVTVLSDMRYQNEVATQPLRKNESSFVDKIDQKVVTWMGLYAVHFIQISLGLIFLWFGALKLIPEMSPAETLVRETSEEFFPLIGINVSPGLALTLLAVWEIIIGLGLLLSIFRRSVVSMIILHMPSTALPLFLLPEVVWTQFPLGLTLEGQYIVKNLIIIGGAMAVGASTRNSRDR